MLKIEEGGWLQLPEHITQCLKWHAGDRLLIQKKGGGVFLCKKETNAAPVFFVRCFGHFSIEYNGYEILIKNKKLKEMLAFLASSNNEFVSKWEIAQHLWPDALKSKAMDCLYKVLRNLTHTECPLRKLPIEIYRDQLRLSLAPPQLDFELFELLGNSHISSAALSEALQLYRGGFLEQEYYDWSILQQMKYEIMLEAYIKKIRNS